MTLADLSRDFSQISNLLPKSGTFAYVDFPVYKNVGDILIFLGTMEFLRRHNVPISGVLTTLDQSPGHLRRMSEFDAILYQGGGNFGDIYPDNQGLRKAVLENAPDARGFIFPQSIQYFDPAKLAADSALFRKNKNLTIFTRDHYSHGIAKQHFSDNVVMSQDMAHSLYDWLAPIREARPPVIGAGERTLYFIRKDKEVGAKGGLEMAANSDGPLDWSDLLSIPKKVHFELYIRAAMASKLLPNLPMAYLYAYENMCKRLVIRLAQRFVQYDHVVTSRLHGVIFSLLLGRRVTIIDNNYGKNSRYADAWLSDVPNLDIALRSDFKDA